MIKLLKKRTHFRKLAYKLLHMLDAFESMKVFTVPIEICENVLSMTKGWELSNQKINSREFDEEIEKVFKERKAILEKNLAEDIVKKKKLFLAYFLIYLFSLIFLLDKEIKEIFEKSCYYFVNHYGFLGAYCLLNGV